MPAWFGDELERDPDAEKGWARLPPSRRKEIQRYFAGLKSAAAQERNLRRALHVLAGGKARFMARDWNAEGDGSHRGCPVASACGVSRVWIRGHIGPPSSSRFAAALLRFAPSGDDARPMRRFVSMGSGERPARRPARLTKVHGDREPEPRTGVKARAPARDPRSGLGLDAEHG